MDGAGGVVGVEGREVVGLGACGEGVGGGVFALFGGGEGGRLGGEDAGGDRGAEVGVFFVFRCW